MGGGLTSAESGLAVVVSKQDVILYVCQVTSLSPKNLSGVEKPNKGLQIPLTGYAVFLSGLLQVLLPKYCFLWEALTDASQSAWAQRTFLLLPSLAGHSASQAQHENPGSSVSTPFFVSYF